VTIRTKDGRSFTNTVYAPTGSAILGIEWADVDLKFRTLAPFAKLSAQTIEASIRLIRNFKDVSNVSELVSLLH